MLNTGGKKAVGGVLVVRTFDVAIGVADAGGPNDFLCCTRHADTAFQMARRFGG